MKFFPSFCVAYNQAQLIFFTSWPYRKYRWCSVFPWLQFFRPDSLFTFYSPQYHVHSAHLSQEGLWWTEGSCSGEASLLGLWI